MSKLKREPLTREAFDKLTHPDRVALEPLTGERWSDHVNRCALCWTVYGESAATGSVAATHTLALSELTRASAREREHEVPNP